MKQPQRFQRLVLVTMLFLLAQGLANGATSSISSFQNLSAPNDSTSATNETAISVEYKPEHALVFHLTYLLKSNGYEVSPDAHLSAYLDLATEEERVQYTMFAFPKMKEADRMQCANMFWLAFMMKSEGRTNASHVFLNDLFSAIDLDTEVFKKMYGFLNSPLQGSDPVRRHFIGRERLLYYRSFYGWLNAQKGPSKLQKQMKELLLEFEFEKLFALFQIDEPYNTEADELDAETNLGLGLSMLLSDNPYSPFSFLEAAAKKKPNDFQVVYAYAVYLDIWEASEEISELLKEYYAKNAPKELNYDTIHLSKIYCIALFEDSDRDPAFARLNETIATANALYGDPNYLNGLLIQETAFEFMERMNADKEILQLEKALQNHLITLGDQHKEVGIDYSALARAQDFAMLDDAVYPISDEELYVHRSKHRLRKSIEYNFDQAMRIFQLHPEENFYELLHVWHDQASYWSQFDAVKSADCYDHLIALKKQNGDIALSQNEVYGASDEYLKTNQFEKAIACHTELIADYKRVRSKPDGEIAIENMHIGKVYQAWGESLLSTNPAEAKERIKQALAYFELCKDTMPQYSEERLQSAVEQTKKMQRDLESKK
ncbi:MAG: hypothetical protein ACKVOK_11580 [Flavobacteriales bacterium]